MNQDDFNSPDLLKLEAASQELLNNTISVTSRTIRLLQYLNFFNQVLSVNNNIATESFLTEFLPDYISCLSSYSVCGIKPELTKELIVQVDNIILTDLFPEQNERLNNQIERINRDFERLNKILEGDEPEESKITKASFPLIEQTIEYGIIDTITIKIEKGSKQNRFIIIPSEKETDKDLSEQIQVSWQLAIDSVKRYVRRPYPHHEVIISFDKKEGIYKGNSLGVALTLSFIQQLLAFYNPAFNINLQSNLAFTGGIDSKGNINSTGSEIIKQKVSAVFYSEINTFIIPKENEDDAELRLKELNQIHPNRNLNLVAVKNLNDILDRRTIVDIKRINPIKRTGRFVKKNWPGALAATLVMIALMFYLVIDFDDNPATLNTDGQNLFVKNRNGKILWTKKVGFPKDVIDNKRIIGRFCKIYDVDGDGINEVLISNELANLDDSNLSGTILNCYNKSNNLIWSYGFNDTVESIKESLEPYYSIFLIDTLTCQNNKSLLLFSSNSASFSSAIFRIDLRTGKRLPGTLWCSGHTADALIKDLNGDGKKDILAIGYDNGYEEQVVFAYTIDTLTQVRLSTDEYTISQFPIANLLSYIRLPKTDYTRYLGVRIPGIEMGSFINERLEKVYKFSCGIGHTKGNGYIWYKLKYNLKDFNLIIDNQFRVTRDSLVAKGILNSPYTDTKEYKEILKNNILYWKDGKWVKREELENMKPVVN